MRMQGGYQMEKDLKQCDLKQCGISEEDIRAGLTDLKGFVDITEEDLMKIYSSALQHAQEPGAVRYDRC